VGGCSEAHHLAPAMGDGVAASVGRRLRAVEGGTGEGGLVLCSCRQLQGAK